MMHKMYGVLIASLSAAALMLAANAATARSAAAPRGGFAPHPMSRHFVGHALRHHRGFPVGAFWPGFYDESPTGEGAFEAGQPISSDIHYTCTYDIPWDWVHRCPPAVELSARPYAPSCPTEAVTVPGHDGEDRTINVTRCY